MRSPHLVGVVTVTYNSAEYLEPFLRCIHAQSHRDFVLFVVDNASKDDTLNRLREHEDQRMVIIANSDNVGVAEGNNQGIRAALSTNCDSILLLNNDTEFGPELVGGLIEGLERYQCDMATPKMLYYFDPCTIWAAGGGFNRWSGQRSFHYGLDQRDSGAWDLPRSVEYAPTCCVLIKKSVFESVGLMDSTYFVYNDDADFLYRAKLARCRMWYLPHLRLQHKASSSTGGLQSSFSVRFATRNRVYFLLKFYGRIFGSAWSLLYVLYYWSRMVTRKDSAGIWKLRLKSFKEAFQLYRSTQVFDRESSPRV
jgi:GT2 family glycosyltransferase